MSQSFCPHLVTLDQNYNQGAPVDYPSFENRCLAGSEGDPLLFPHQATFCLSSGHRMCARFKAAQSAAEMSAQARRTVAAGRAGKVTGSKASGAAQWQSARAARSVAPPEFIAVDDAHTPDVSVAEPTSQVDEWVENAWLENRRRWGWIGAGAVFIAVLVIGGLVAAYAGWQFANAQLENTAGTIASRRIESVGQNVTTPAFIIQTATSQGPEPSAANQTVTISSTPQQQPANGSIQNGFINADSAANIADSVSLTTSANSVGTFPQAVTATPGSVAAPGAENPAFIPATSETDAPVIVLEPPSQPAIQVPPPASEPLVNVNVEVPTRRPTPIPDIAVGNAPALSETVLLNATATPTLGAPLVVFGADAKVLKPGACTTVRWEVKNVKAVYYENRGVNGQGEIEECIRDANGEYSLKVILGDDSTKIYTTTIQVELPTATPLPTFTFTPEIIPSATWTPEPPTATPTPNIRRGVGIAVQGETRRGCAAGAMCAIGILVTNTGDAIDNLTAQKLAGDAWNAQFCRGDGVCGGSLPLVSVGPGNTVFLELRLSIPRDAVVGQTNSYQFSARSDGSNGNVNSETVTVEVVVQ